MTDHQELEKSAQDKLQGRLVYLASEDLRVAASLLFQAYQDDPLFQQIFQVDKEGYEQRLRAAIREELSAFWQAQHPMFGVFEDETLEGVVCLTRPGEHFGDSRVWHWRLKMLLTAGLVSTKQLLEKERLIKEAMPVDNYHMVSFIAVHPRYQQKGLGDLLVRAVEHELEQDETSKGVAVFATRPQYEKFFAARDYRQVAELEVNGIRGALLFHDRPEQ
ncbi:MULTISPECIES: GNAT family N-acetyltransferase [Gammaproteobacteria]|uniref:GNAT family N-acetyltransferase n=1 Tax=Gammaproteobacteria TaxID=1236 RepID=UPI000DCF7D9D|nr:MULTISPECIES: GNAT family N-acetyltransferase [Gammaproteobacteria]RTE86984.1 GNAT family N-acetyltransferase [Aliidiomarina sp. B3213]TCZ93226.1 GNAT family N-acetyltransferase [Lysobacter sp. N42]